MSKQLLIACTILLVSSCTIQKRHFRPGYSIQWKKSYASSGEHKKDKKDDTSDALWTTEYDLKTEVSDVEKSLPDELEERMSKTPAEMKSEELALDRKSGVSRSFSNGSQTTPRKQSTDRPEIKTALKSPNRSNGDYWTYLVSGLMILSSFGGAYLGRKKLNSITRWASKNPGKARYLITSVQLPLLAMSVYGGYNLSQMGYTLSDSFMYTSIALLTLGTTAMPFLPKQDKFVLPGRLNRRRLAFVSATVGGCMLAMGYGNSVGFEQHESFAGNVLSQVDQVFFDKGISSDPFNGESVALHDVKMEAQNDMRAAMNGGLCAVAVLLYILLTVTLCAGVCMIVFGVAGGAGLGAVGLFVGGLLVAGLSLYGMISISNAHWCRR